MPDMLIVAAFELGDPVMFVVQMKPGDASLHVCSAARVYNGLDDADACGRHTRDGARRFSRSPLVARFETLPRIRR